VVSGDISKSIYARQILTTKFNTKVFFSALGSFKPSVLQKYEGFFKSNTLEGATRVKFE
jgi:hypothetical protein